MNHIRKHLDRVFHLARQSWSPAPADEPSGPEDAAFFARRVAAEWARTAQRPDSLRLWERVGRWSLATAVAVWLLAALLQPQTAPTNPFEPLVSDAAEENPFLDIAP